MRSLLCVGVAVLLLAPSLHADPRAGSRPRIDVVTLGRFEGALETRPMAINDGGVVVGFAWDGSSETAFMWTRDRGFRTILSNAVAYDINNRNEVVGLWRSCSSCPASGFIWRAATGMRDLGNFVPVAINNRGDMAGSCGWESRIDPCVLSRNGTLTQINATPDGGIAIDINDRRVVTGFAYRPGEGEAEGGLAPHAFTWLASRGVQMLDRGDADDSSPSEINNRGTVVGSVTYNGVNARLNAAVWSKGKLITLRGPERTTFSAVNDRDWIVGDGPHGPMLWRRHRAVVVLPTPGNAGGSAADINNAGQIVGTSGADVVMWRVR